MEISLREWLIIGAIFVIALILFDGWRRIRANRNRLRIDIDKTLSEIGDTSHHNPELPNGGARVRSSVEPTITLSPQDSSLQPEAEDNFEPEPRFGSEPEIPAEQELPSALTSTDERVEEPLPESDDTDVPMLRDINPSELQDGMIDAFDLESDAASATTKALDEGDAEDDLKAALSGEPEEATETAETEPDEPQAAEPETATDDFEWDPELERQFDTFDEPEPEPQTEVRADDSYTPAEPEVEPEVSNKDPKRDLSELDPLFDDIPSDRLDDDPFSQAYVEPAADDAQQEPNLYLDLDLEQPIHQIMANKAATNDTGRDTARRAPEKPRRRQVENPSFTLPLDEPEDDLPDMGLSALEPESERKAEQPAEPKAHASRTSSEVASKSAAAAARKALTDLPDPDEVLVITVVGRDRQKLPGVPLQKVVEACGMEFGDMSIYHRFEGDAAASSLQFSMANAVNPGTFDPDAMDELETPAVSFFMSMREPKDPMTAYECMLATAETLAKHLDGDLLDEDRSVMREQTKEHYRQRIRDFEMQSRRRKSSR